MIEQIKELIVLYAPTVLMAIATVVNYLKIFKGLKQENLQRELAETQRLLAQQAKDNAEIKQLNRELINEVSKVKKYENISTDKKI
jgi:hypothetical protein